LAKLVRVLKASRLFHRWEASAAINYNALKFRVAMIMFAIGTHWASSAWVLAGKNLSGKPEETWLSTWTEPLTTSLEVYFTALYWGCMTATSIGYGDIKPANYNERLICTFLITVVGFLQAWCLGEIMTSIAESGLHTQLFRRNIDDLNGMLREYEIPQDMRRRLRNFFFEMKDLSRVRSYQRILEQMSMALQSEVALQANELWMGNVWYFNHLTGGFSAQLAMKFRVYVHTASEAFGEPWYLYIILKGLVGRKSRIMTRGDCFGEDFLLAKLELHDTWRARALSFTEVQYLSRDDCEEVLVHHPCMWVHIRRAVVLMALRRGILHVANMLRAKKKNVIFGRPLTSPHDFILEFSKPDALLVKTNSRTTIARIASDWSLGEQENSNQDASSDVVAVSSSEVAPLEETAGNHSSLEMVSKRQSIIEDDMSRLMAADKAMHATLASLIQALESESSPKDVPLVCASPRGEVEYWSDSKPPVCVCDD
jgi:hypothetical protein